MQRWHAGPALALTVVVLGADAPAVWRALSVPSEALLVEGDVVKIRRGVPGVPGRIPCPLEVPEQIYGFATFAVETHRTPVAAATPKRPASRIGIGPHDIDDEHVWITTWAPAGHGMVELPGYLPFAVVWGHDRIGPWCRPERIDPIPLPYPIHVTIPPTDGTVTVEGCGQDSIELPAGSEVELRTDTLPCWLRSTVTAGSLAVDGNPVEVRDDRTAVLLGTPAWTPGGIGVTFGPGRTVARLLPGGPAERAGLAVGDRIVGVDGDSLEGVASRDAPRRIIGPVGAPVTLRIARGEGAFEVTIERALIGRPND